MKDKKPNETYVEYTERHFSPSDGWMNDLRLLTEMAKECGRLAAELKYERECTKREWLSLTCDE